MSSKGQAIRTYIKGISVIGRNTQGVRIIRLAEEEGEKVASFAVVPKSELNIPQTKENADAQPPV
jgi:DNA gyrase subunit A